MFATKTQIDAIVEAMTLRGAIRDGKLISGWGNTVGVPTGANQYHDNPHVVLQQVSTEAASEWLATNS